jgi:hypothetical protein
MLVVAVGCELEADGDSGDAGASPDGGDGGASPDGGDGGVSPDGGDVMGCSIARFELSPTGGSPYTLTREVCFHSEGNVGECPIFNYSMPPNTDFSEFVDIFYGGTVCQDNFLSEFADSGNHYIFSGVPTRSPTNAGTGPLATGTYFVLTGRTESGNFEYVWPTN